MSTKGAILFTLFLLSLLASPYLSLKAISEKFDEKVLFIYIDPQDAPSWLPGSEINYWNDTILPKHFNSWDQLLYTEVTLTTLMKYRVVILTFLGGDVTQYLLKSFESMFVEYVKLGGF